MASETGNAGDATSDPKETMLPQAEKDKAPAAMPPQAEKDKARAVEDNVEDFPDPDEDDLDDLDEFLDDFSASKPAPKAPVPQASSGAASGAAPSTAATPPVPAPTDDGLDESLAKELEKGMSDFFGGLDKNPEMQAEFQEMFKQIAQAAEAEASGSGAKPATSQAEPSKSSDQPPADADFQETIRRTMERMKASGDKTTEDLSNDNSKDMLNDLMGLLGSGLGEGGDEGGLNKMLMGMMEQLTNKEILYEPMKELHDQFPGWLEKNKDKVSAEDMKRYNEQRVIVAEIVAKFDEPSYSDDNPAQREYIVERMQKMQETGSPPQDLVGDLQSAQDALNAPNDEACNPQ